MNTKTLKKLNNSNYCYESDKVLGITAISVVYRGVDLSTKELVAIKEICKSRFTDGKEKYILREIEHLQQVNNSERQCQNIVRLLNTYESSTSYFLVFELCEQGTLKNLLQDLKRVPNGYFDEKDALMLFVQVLRGYNWLYEHGIMHRDLKLENIFIKNKILKIGDFGCSVPADRQQHTQLTFTVAYAAPELLLEEENYNYKVDVWSLGIILFYLLTGYHPFDADKLTEVAFVKKMLKEDIKTLFPKKPELSDDVKDLLSRMLTRDPAKRISWEEIISHKWVAEELGIIEGSESSEESKGGAISDTSALTVIENTSQKQYMEILENCRQGQDKSLPSAQELVAGAIILKNISFKQGEIIENFMKKAHALIGFGILQLKAIRELFHFANFTKKSDKQHALSKDLYLAFCFTLGKYSMYLKKECEELLKNKHQPLNYNEIEWDIIAGSSEYKKFAKKIYEEHGPQMEEAFNQFYKLLREEASRRPERVHPSIKNSLNLAFTKEDSQEVKNALAKLIGEYFKFSDEWALKKPEKSYYKLQLILTLLCKFDESKHTNYAVLFDQLETKTESELNALAKTLQQGK